jgi:phospholipase/carboxylesterase
MFQGSFRAALALAYRTYLSGHTVRAATDRLPFIHSFDDSVTGDQPLLLLHGTGGNELSLLRFGRKLAPRSPLLSPRGKVLEDGATRFFRRFAPNALDEEDVRRRGHELADFIEEARVYYRLPAPIAVGYSNGANMATTLLLLRPETLAGAILLRAAQITLSDFQPPDLSGKPVLLLSGADDPTILPERFALLVASLSGYGASLETRILPVGHDLSRADIPLARLWMESNFQWGGSHAGKTLRGSSSNTQTTTIQTRSQDQHSGNG